MLFRSAPLKPPVPHARASMEPQPGSWGDAYAAPRGATQALGFNGAPARKLGRRGGIRAADRGGANCFNGAPARKLGRPHRPRVIVCENVPASMEPQPGSWGDSPRGARRLRRRGRFNGAPARKLGRRAPWHALHPAPDCFNGAPARKLGRRRRGGARGHDPARFNGAPARKLGRPPRYRPRGVAGRGRLQWSPSPEAGETPGWWG